MTDALIAWTAGLFEAEGTCCRQNGRTLTLKVSMTDEDVVARWGAAIGVGCMFGPYARAGGGKPVFTWQVCRAAEAITVCERLRPWLGLRRRQQFSAILAGASTSRLGALPAALRMLPTVRSAAMTAAWAAALFEGEGHFAKHNRTLALLVTTTDLDVALRWGAAVGVGRLYGPWKPGPYNRKPIYRWEVYRHDEAVAVYGRLERWLGERRRARCRELLAVRPPTARRISEPGPLCGFYSAPVACRRGYTRHQSRHEPACQLCRECKRLCEADARRRPRFS